MSRAGLCALVEKIGLEIAGEGSTLAEGLQHLNGIPTDIVLVITVDTPNHGLQALEEARQKNIAVRALIVTRRGEPEVVQRLVLAGACGVVYKDKTADQLLTAIRRVHDGELWVDRLTATRIITDIAGGQRSTKADPEHTKIASLTPRERELIKLVAIGCNNKTIAARMKISDSTVRHHLTSIFDKLDVPDRLGLVIYAFRHDLAPQVGR